MSKESNLKDIGMISTVLIESDSKKSADDWSGRNSQNKMVVFPKSGGGFVKGEYAKVLITDCTGATLIGKVVL